MHQHLRLKNLSRCVIRRYPAYNSPTPDKKVWSSSSSYFAGSYTSFPSEPQKLYHICLLSCEDFWYFLTFAISSFFSSGMFWLPLGCRSGLTQVSTSKVAEPK